ncbi:unnamed protein product, partial [Polarella glacialis]
MCQLGCGKLFLGGAPFADGLLGFTGDLPLALSAMGYFKVHAMVYDGMVTSCYIPTMTQPIDNAGSFVKHVPLMVLVEYDIQDMITDADCKVETLVSIGRVFPRLTIPSLPLMLVPDGLKDGASLAMLQVSKMKLAVLPLSVKLRAFFLWETKYLTVPVFLYFLTRAGVSFTAFAYPEGHARRILMIMAQIRNGILGAAFLGFIVAQSRFTIMVQGVIQMVRATYIWPRNAPQQPEWKFYKTPEAAYEPASALHVGFIWGFAFALCSSKEAFWPYRMSSDIFIASIYYLGVRPCSAKAKCSRKIAIGELCKQRTVTGFNFKAQPVKPAYSAVGRRSVVYFHFQCQTLIPWQVTVNLSSLNIVDVAEEDLAFFGHLDRLDVSDNQLGYEHVLEQLSRVPKLSTLNLACNSISSLQVPANIFRHLEALDLSFNGLHGDVLSQLARLSSLITLNLSSNCISSVPPEEELLGLQALEELILDSNDL